MPKAKKEETPAEAATVTDPAEPAEATDSVGAPAKAGEPEAEVTPDRHEVFEATRPNGTVVIIDRNIETGEQTVTEKE